MSDNTFIAITNETIDINKTLAFVNTNQDGAISSFIGTTRDNFNGKKVVRLEYEAYDAMAIKEMEKICTSIRLKWSDVHRICIVHRLGVVEVGQASVVIHVSSPHRKAALEATSFAIDALKGSVPVWKLEVYQGDSRVWKENAEWNGPRIMVPGE